MSRGPREKLTDTLIAACGLYGRDDWFDFEAARTALASGAWPDGSMGLNERDCERYHPLSLAAARGHITLVKLLLGAGATILPRKTEYSQYSPDKVCAPQSGTVCVALEHKHLHVAQALLQALKARLPAAGKAYRAAVHDALMLASRNSFRCGPAARGRRAKGR